MSDFDDYIPIILHLAFAHAELSEYVQKNNTAIYVYGRGSSICFVHKSHFSAIKEIYNHKVYDNELLVKKFPFVLEVSGKIIKSVPTDKMNIISVSPKELVRASDANACDAVIIYDEDNNITTKYSFTTNANIRYSVRFKSEPDRVMFALTYGI